MSRNQEGVHAAVRAQTGTTGTYLEDWHALFTAGGIAAGPWNSRMIPWINGQLSSTYSNLNEAKHAFAVSQGFNGWTDMNTFAIGGGGGGPGGANDVLLLANGTDGILLVDGVSFLKLAA